MTSNGTRRVFLLLSMCVVVLIMSSFIAAPTVRAQTLPSCSPNYVVKQGDNLFRIGLAFGVSWPVLAQINGIIDANRIFAGQIICLPGSIIATGTPLPPPVTATPGGPYTMPPPGVFPTIAFNTYRAAIGDTLQITGQNFPANANVNIYITPLGTPYPATASGTATVAANGTLSTNFAIPGDVAGVPLSGGAFSIMVKDPVSGYFGYNFFYNTRP
jgi:LysM repeat protein